MSCSTRADGKSLPKFPAAFLSLLLALSLGLACVEKKPSFDAWLNALPDKDTSQLLNPGPGFSLPGKKVKIADHYQDAWILAPNDRLEAEAACGTELALSLALLTGDKKLFQSSADRALAEMEIISGKARHSQILLDTNLSKTASQWTEYRLRLQGPSRQLCKLRLSFAIQSAQSQPRIRLAVADSRLISSTPSSRPNIIIISVDTMRADHMGIYGYSRNTTPNIDRFAKTALIFTNTVSASSFTVPSVASLFTSLYPSEHGAIGKDQMTLAPSNLTLAEILADNGYRTACFSASPFVSPEFGFGQGFQNFFLINSPHAHALNQLLIPWLSAHYQEQPFFLYVMYFDPHQPYEAPPPYDALFQKDSTGKKLWPDQMLKQKPVRISKLKSSLSATELEFVKSQFDSEVAYVDHFLGELLDQISARGLLDNSLLVLTADHGEEFLEHHGFGHSRTLYREVLAVPFIFYHPAISEPGRKIEQMVRTIDCLPTILDFAGISPPQEIQGRTLKPLLLNRGQMNTLPAFAELRPFLNPKLYLKALDTQKFKLIYNSPSQKLELYDLVNDPREMTDLATRFPDSAAARLQEMLAIEKSLRKIPPAGPKAAAEEQKLLKSLGYVR